MRTEFSNSIYNIMAKNKEILFLTGDLGFMALENIKNDFADRFINAGVSEQNMITMAAALSKEGFTVICYSISPFAIFRPCEQIRNDICLHNANVKIVGNGGGYGYGIMGPTHHAIEDLSVVLSFPNIKAYIPFCNEHVDTVLNNSINSNGPSYIRLGYGLKPKELNIPTHYLPINKLANGDSITIVCLGPILLNVFSVINEFKLTNKVDLFVVNEMPLKYNSDELLESVKKTNKLLIIEEHIKQGGLGSNVIYKLNQNKIKFNFNHLYALGYPDGKYGSQKYHQEQSKLDTKSIYKAICEFL